MTDREPNAHPLPTRVAGVAVSVSVLLLAFLALAWWGTGSLIALSQAADSASDLLTGVVLIIAARVAAQPADEGHPHGHHAAEPIAALFVALLAGGLAMEVVRSALEALVFGHDVDLSWVLLGALSSKTLLKGLVLGLARWAQGRVRSPVVHALAVDARNDVIVGTMAVVGTLAARFGWPALDAWLALPAGVWVGWSGFELGRENVAVLMGKAATPERCAELAALAEGVPGVRSVHGLKARNHGPELEVTLHVVLDDALSLRAAHDIGVAVEAALLAEPDVVRVGVHLDVEEEGLRA